MKASIRRYSKSIIKRYALLTVTWKEQCKAWRRESQIQFLSSSASFNLIFPLLTQKDFPTHLAQMRLQPIACLRHFGNARRHGGIDLVPITVHFVRAYVQHGLNLLANHLRGRAFRLRSLDVVVAELCPALRDRYTVQKMEMCKKICFYISMNEHFSSPLMSINLLYN